MASSGYSLLSAWKAQRQRYWLALTFDVLLILLVMGVIHSWQTRALPLGEGAPATILPQLGLQRAADATQAGQVGVVYFFAPWCGVCRHSISNLDDLVQSGAVAWGTVVALDYSTVEEVREFIDQTGVSLPVLLGDRQTALDWGITAFPTYFVIDPDGRIDSRSVGYSTWLGLLGRSRLAAWGG